MSNKDVRLGGEDLRLKDEDVRQEVRPGSEKVSHEARNVTNRNTKSKCHLFLAGLRLSAPPLILNRLCARVS